MSVTGFTGLLEAADWKRYLSEESGFKCVLACSGVSAVQLESSLRPRLSRLGVALAIHLDSDPIGSFETLAAESFMAVVLFGNEDREASFYKYGYLKGSGKAALAFRVGKETEPEEPDESGGLLTEGFFSGRIDEMLSEPAVDKIVEAVPGALASYFAAGAVREAEGRLDRDAAELSERLVRLDSLEDGAQAELVALESEFSHWAHRAGTAVPPEILFRLAYHNTRFLETCADENGSRECRERALAIYESIISRGYSGLSGALARKKLGDLILFYPGAPGSTENAERAEQLYREALGITEKGLHSNERFSTSNNLGLALVKLGAAIDSRDYIKAAADSFAASILEGSDIFSPEEIALVNLNLGMTYLALGEYELSAESLAGPLEFYNEHEYPHQSLAAMRSLGEAYSALADTRLDVRDIEGAVGYLRSAAFAYRARSFSGEYAYVKAKEGRALAELAFDNNDCSRAIQAIDSYGAAADYYREAGQAEEYGVMEDALSSLYEFLGRYEAPTPERALGAYSEIAEACADGASPGVYARAMVKLGGIYEALAAEDDRIYNREKAIESYFNSLAYYNLENRPEEYAAVKIRLAGIYRKLAAILEEPGLFEKSIYSCRQALRVYTEESVPEVYGELMADIGEASAALTILEGGGNHFQDALEAYEKALGVYETPGSEEMCSKLRENITGLYPSLEGVCESEPGNAASICGKYLVLLGDWSGAGLRAGVLERLGDHSTGTVWEAVNKNRYKKAADIYREAVRLLGPEPSADDLERLSVKIGNLYKRLAEMEAAADNPGTAAEYYDEAFAYFPERLAEAEYADAGRALGSSFRRLYEAGGSSGDCRKAIAAYWEALKYAESSGDDRHYSETALTLAGLYASLAESEEREGRASEALECYAELLSLYEPESFPGEYAEAQRRVAGFYSRLADTEDRPINIGLAISSYKEALSYYAETGAEARRQETAGLVSALYRALGDSPEAGHDMRIGYYQEAIAYGDTSPVAYESLGEAYLAASGAEGAADNLLKAADCFLKAIETGGFAPDSPEYGRLAASHEKISEKLKELALYVHEAESENPESQEPDQSPPFEDLAADAENVSIGGDGAPQKGGEAYADCAREVYPVFHEEVIPEGPAAAVEHCRKRLGEVSQTEHPKVFASLLYRLGNACLEIASSGNSLENYLKAVDSFTQSLRVYDVNGSPAEYAKIRKQMGLTYAGIARVNGDPDYYVRAVRAFSEALNIYTFERCPDGYGFIKKNIGSAYEGLSAVSDKIANSQSAAGAYEEALEYYTHGRFPEEHTAILVSLGAIYQLLAESVDGAANCKKAIDCYDMILGVYNLEDHPEEYAAALNNLGVVYRMLAEHEDKAESCTRALGCYSRALRVYTEADYAIQYGSTKNNVGLAYMTLADAADRESNCKHAVRAFEDALRVRTIQNHPMQFAATQNNLGIVYRMLSEIEDRARNCKRAINAYETALIVYSAEKFPLEYATTRNNIGGAYSTLAEEEDRTVNCDRAAQAYREALKVFTRDRFPGPHEIVRTNLERLFEFYGKDLSAH